MEFLEAYKEFLALGYEIIVVTNQSEVGRKLLLVKMSFRAY